MARTRRRAPAARQNERPKGPRSGPQALSKTRVHPYSKAHPEPSAADGAGWTIREICAAYNWPEPKDVAGGGTIAVIHLAGEWLKGDVARFFEYQGIAKEQQPHVFDSPPEDGPASGPSSPATDADQEVALDIQIAGASYALATGQPATIRIYKGAQSAEGLISALRAATQDECDVCCITWGKDEQSWNAADVAAFNDAAKAAVDNGMIIVAASGDNDSSDGGPTPANVDFPASSPYVIGCGGTKLLHQRERGSESQQLEWREEVWNKTPGLATGRGSGGGFSELFSIPDWQLGTVQARMRMVPDIAAHADPETGYRIFVGGQPRIIGGTSAATALYAGLFAAFGPKRGFITPELYKNQVCFNDIRSGDNGMFRAMVGPDPCTGIGSPRADLLAERIGSDAAALARLRRQVKDARVRFPWASTADDRQPPCCQTLSKQPQPAALAPRVVGQPGTHAKWVYIDGIAYDYVWDCDGGMIAKEHFRPC
jgi:Subtilase family